MTRRPNILLILADEHRWDCLGAYGNRDIRTPCLDSLAHDGVRFDNCFCPYPVCTPSRYSLLSGRYVHEHRGWTNRSTPAPGVVMFPELLRQSGYRTAAVGKMHFTPTYLDVGFERMVLSEQDGNGRYDDDYHRDLRARGLVDAQDLRDQEQYWRAQAPPEYWQRFGASVSDLPEEMHSTTWIGERAMEELAGWSGGGNCLMVGFIKPHHPFDPPARWARMYDPDAVGLLPGWTCRVPERDRELYEGYFPNDRLTEAAMRLVTACYYATISHLDHHVGRMVDLLRRRRMYDETMIIYTADHGDYVGFHHMLLKGGYMYDPLVKVPLIVKFPAGQRAGSVRSGLASLVDVAPTILSVAGVGTEQELPGEDLSAGPTRRRVVFAAHRRRTGQDHGGGLHVMARSADRKLLANPDGGRFLFDLAADPLELDDRSADSAEQPTIERLESAAADWLGPDGNSDEFRDESAPTIRQPNVPPPEGSHRRAMIDYLASAMRSRQSHTTDANR